MGRRLSKAAVKATEKSVRRTALHLGRDAPNGASHWCHHDPGSTGTASLLVTTSTGRRLSSVPPPGLTLPWCHQGSSAIIWADEVSLHATSPSTCGRDR